MRYGTTQFPSKWGAGKIQASRWDHQQNSTSGGKNGGKGKIKLCNQSRLLLTVNGLYAAANALSGAFVNVYLWKARNDFSIIGWFTLIHYISMAVTFWVAGKWVKEHNKMSCLRTGVAISALFYTLVLIFGEKAADYFFILGIVQGISAGLFWLAFNVVYFEVTDPDTRDRFNGWAGLLGAGAGMIAPWISGLLITRMSASTGYRLIFTLSLVTFLIGVAASLFLKKRKTEGEYEWLLTWRCLKRKDTAWRKVGAALAAQGFREGVFGFIIALLVYVNTGNEMKLGNYALITSAVALISFYLTGRILRKNRRRGAMLAGALMIVLIILPFFWKVSFTTLLLFGVVVALFFPLYSIPMTSTVFDLIGSDDESVKRREEYIVMRELALNTGRIAGTVLFITVISINQSPITMNWLLLMIGSSPLVTWYFMNKVLKEKEAHA